MLCISHFVNRHGIQGEMKNSIMNLEHKQITTAGKKGPVIQLYVESIINQNLNLAVCHFVLMKV